MQGQPYGETLYPHGGDITVTLQGSRYGTAYRAGSSTTVTLQGSEYTRTLYTKSGDTYTELTTTLYRAGSSVTYTLQGGSIGTVYYEGDETTFKLRKDSGAIESAYQLGTYYSGGLFANFEPAQVETQDIMVLVV